MMRNVRRALPNIFKEGTKHRQGVQEAVLRNIEACVTLADLTKTSFGPVGLNKLVVNHLEKIFVTSDTTTLLNEMEIAHPAAKLCVMAANMQEAEIGDGSNTVIMFIGELLKKAAELIEMGLHPSEILQGYQNASKLVLQHLEELALEDFTIESNVPFTVENLERAMIAPIASKQYGVEIVLSKLIAEACLAVMPKNHFNFTVDSIRVVKILGGNLHQSHIVKGIVLPSPALGLISKVENAKVAVYTGSLGAADTETKGTILLHNAKELMDYNDSEEKQVENIFKEIADAGVRVVVTGSTCDDIALHFCEKFNIMVVKTLSKFELRRICRATGARAIPQMVAPRPEEIGFAAHVYVKEVGSSKITVFEQEQGDDLNVATIVLRASTHNILNDVERAIDDGVNTVRAITRDGRFVAGAGAVEIELARKLASIASTTPGLEQYALNKFAEAFEVVPRALAENSGQNTMTVISSLYAAHERGETRVGVDMAGGIHDATKENIVDLLILKKQAFKLAVDAVLTVLRVDSIIMAKPAGGPKMGQQGGHWDDED